MSSIDTDIGDLVWRNGHHNALFHDMATTGANCMKFTETSPLLPVTDM